MRLWLRAIHARVSRAARSDGFRAQDFCQADGGRGARAHALTHPDWHRRDCNRHRDRSVSAGRAKIWTHALDARSVRADSGTEPVDHDQIESYRSRPRAAQEDQSALEAVSELFADNARSHATTSPGAARTAAGA